MILQLVKKHFFLIFLMLLTLPASYYLIIPGFYEPHDLHHLADIYEMFRAFESGQIPPRLGPDFTYGFGYPLFNFYYVLPFYLGAIFLFISKSLTASFELVFIFSFVISMLGMFFFLREFFGKYSSLAGAALYLYTPYRAVQTYVRGAMGEALAVAILPFIFWGIVRLAKKPDIKNISQLGIVIGFFLLSHNYLWLLAGFWIVVFSGIMIYLNKARKKVIFRLLLSAFLGLGLSFYWWFPALSEYKLVSSITPFKFEDHFPFIKQLIIPSWGYGASVWGPGDEISFQIGVVNLLSTVALAVTLFLKRHQLGRKLKLIGAWVLLGFLASVFFMNIRSLFLWKLIPIYQFVQFPWRLLFLTAFFTSISLAIFLENIPKTLLKKVTVLIILVTIGLYFNYFKPSKVVHKSDDNYLGRMFGMGDDAKNTKEYEDWSEDYLLLPKWVEKRPTKFPDNKIEGGKNAEILNINKISSIRWKAQVISKDNEIVTFNSYYFPGWFAKVDGKNTELDYGKPYGQIDLEVSKGGHEIEFYWKETPKRKFADIVSFATLIFLAPLFFKKSKPT